MTDIESLLNSKGQIYLENKIFTKPIITAEVYEISGFVKFQNCTFQSSFTLYSNVFLDSVLFYNCMFEELSLTAVQFKDKLRIQNCLFNKELEIWDSMFFGKVSFVNNQFKGGINLFTTEDSESYGWNEFYQGMIFRQEWESE